MTFKATSSQNTPRQPTTGNMVPPMIGAIAGTKPVSAIRPENARAACLP